MMRRQSEGRPALALVPPLPPEPVAPSVSFCGHCGASTETAGATSRVCPKCELGLLLHSAAAVAPAQGDAFLVLDSSLSICAVSAAAEELLATRETDAVNRHVTELLVPADAEAQERENLAVAITWAARGGGGCRRAVVRPANTFGVRLTVRIAGCGPRPAALVVFE